MQITGALHDTLEDTNAAQVKRYYAEHLEDNWAEKETGGSVR